MACGWRFCGRPSAEGGLAGARDGGRHRRGLGANVEVQEQRVRVWNSQQVFGPRRGFGSVR